MVLVIYFLLSLNKNQNIQKVFLIIASLVFYAYFNFSYIFLILISIALNYYAAYQISNEKFNEKISKFIFIIGIAFNISFLIYFKYHNFFVDNINQVFSTNLMLRNIVLPLGISFFTFQQLSFLISVKKKEEKISGIIDFSLFVTFFPQLVAGPIVLYGEMIPQYEKQENRRFNAENFAKGLYIFSIGLFKKVVIADTFALFANNGFQEDELRLSIAWGMTLAYTLQIYFDFSGYSDMAIGLGKMFNIEIPRNFISPYKSNSITNFWQRWHITLGRALKTYVYIPLGGNRKSKYRTYFNLIITFLVSGLWHGASWTFVIWGIFHGLFIIIERVFEMKIKKIPSFIRIFSTFIIVHLLWVLFRSESFEKAIDIYKALFNFKSIELLLLSNLTLDGIVNFPTIIGSIYVFVLIGFALFIVFKAKSSFELYESFKPSYHTLFYSVTVFVVSIIHLSKISPFIYFNF
jgi:alginate O-acetyltransferase complex protein AlgI